MKKNINVKFKLQNFFPGFPYIMCITFMFFICFFNKSNHFLISMIIK